MSHAHWSGKPTIGVLAGWQFYRTATNLSYLKPLYNGINEAAKKLACNVFFACGIGVLASAEDPVRPAWPIPAPDVDIVPISPFNTDGLIVFNPLHSADRSRYIQDLILKKHPVLFVGSGESGPTLAADNYQGVFEAIQHFVAHGHREIAFIAGSPGDISGDTGERLNAYYKALESHGLESDQRRVVFGRHVFDGGYAAMHQLLDAQVGFTAIVSSNDEMALGAMKALQERGYRIPHDVALIGFDNRMEDAASTPPLSSVQVPLFTMGQMSLELMLQHLQGKNDLPMLTRVPTHLIIRESCGCSPKRYYQPRDSKAARLTDPVPILDSSKLALLLSRAILSQTQSLGENECVVLCQSLVDAFYTSLKQKTPDVFLQVFLAIMEQRSAKEDEIGIWQDALDLLNQQVSDLSLSDVERDVAKTISEESRQLIIRFLQRQYRYYVTNQLWTSSRLSLLSASLTTALEEKEIFKTLEQHLPAMGIKLARIVLFSQSEYTPQSLSTMWNVLDLSEPALSFPTQEFPPAGVLNEDSPYTLTLIPLVHQGSQTGYAVFETENFDLYGSIVQEVAGALNTARLHHQAVEGLRLAEEANRMRTRFLSTISHELRTPINIIMGISSMLMPKNDESNSPLPEREQKDISRIYAYAQHLGGLIGDLVDLAVSDAGQLRLNFQKVDLGQTLRLISETGSMLAAEKGLTWEANLPETGPWVWGDPTRLRQVVLNLINNAIKFTSTGGINLRVEENSDTVSISVQDTGLGIPIEEQTNIFDEFRQSERSLAKGYGGLGLGLSICKRLVDLHGGSLTLFSTGEEGSGSTFTFTLPILPPEMAETPRPEQLSEIAPRVMILTKQKSTVKTLSENLTKRSFDVQIALVSNEFDRSFRIDGPRPETFIIDVSSDATLGWKVLRDIKSNRSFSGIPVMFFSASQADQSLIELNYLTKPIEISELTKALDEHWLMTNPGRTICNILVVDDEPETLDLHARIVQAHSAYNRVLKARNGKEALDLLQSEIVDLMLLDLQMPEMDGFEVLEAMQAKETTRKIPVIVVTGKVLSESELDRLNQGVTTVLAKGVFSVEETIGHINRALEQKRRISSEAKRLVRSAMVYLHENYSQPISRRDIARHIGVSEDHMTFCFRKELGITPISYLQRYRINQAKHLLKETDQSITTIAFNVGYSDSGYFSRVFRRETGISPEQYRQSSPE